MYAVIAVIAITIGVAARRAAAFGVVGVAAFALVTAFVAVTRLASHVSDVMPAVIGGLAGVAALLWLVRASAPGPGSRTAPAGPRRHSQEDTMTGSVNRRKFLAAAGVTAVGAAAAGVGGELMFGKDFRKTAIASPSAPGMTASAPPG